VSDFFDTFVEMDYARGGTVAKETVKLDVGPLEQFPHSMEPHLRSLGLPTSLQRGVIHLIKEHTVCTKGQVLTPEQAKILVSVPISRLVLSFMNNRIINSEDPWISESASRYYYYICMYMR
jgi:hypothetical protein